MQLFSQAGFSQPSWRAGGPLTQAPLTQAPSCAGAASQFDGRSSSEGASGAERPPEGAAARGLPPTAASEAEALGSESDDDDPLGLKTLDVLEVVRRALSS